MHLREMDLKNFRRFARTTVEFPDGVIGILGPNGAGKSTLVEALGWVLYGHDAARTTKDEIRRQGADGDVRVGLTFGLDGHTYRVVREMLGKDLAASATLTVDGKEVVPGGAKSHAEVTEYVERLLGMDREAFFTSIVAKQNELDALSAMTPGQRKEVLLRMLNVDALDRAIDRVRRDRRETKKQAKTLRSTLTDPEELAEERSRLAAQKKKLDAEQTRISDRENEVRKRLDELKARRDDLRDAEKDHADAKARLESAREKREDLKARRDRLESDVEAARKAQARLDELGDVEAEVEQAKRRFEELDERRERAAKRRQLRERLQDLEDKREDLELDEGRGEKLEEARDEVETELEEVEADIRRVQGHLERIRSDMVKAREAKTELADRLDTFEELGPDSPCPTCRRPLGEAHPDLVDRSEDEMEERTAELKRLERRESKGESSLKELGGRRSDLKARLEGIDEERAAWRDARSTARTLDREIDDVRDALEDLGEVDFDGERYEEAKDALQEAEDKRSRQIKLRERAARLEEVTAERDEVEEALADVGDTIEEAEERVASTRPKAERYREVVETHDEVLDELDDVQQSKAELEGRRARIASEQERVEAEQDRQDEVRREVASLEEKVRYLTKLAGPRESGLLLDFRKHLIARVRPALADTASTLFTALTDGRYADLDLDEEYNLLIRDDGESYTQERFSGGEVDLANLCLRLAVGRLIAERGGQAGLDVVVLDEVFGSQDQNRRDNILRTLEQLTGQFRQILVITHVESVQDRLEHILAVEADDGTSTATWGA